MTIPHLQGRITHGPALIVVCLLAVPACIPVTSVTPPTQNTDEGPAEFTVDTSDAATVAVAEGEEAQSAGSIEINGDIPSRVYTGTVSVSADSIEFSKEEAEEEEAREAQITMHIASSSHSDPCDEDLAVLDFTATETDEGTISLSGDSSATITGTTFERVRSGDFVLCTKVVANFTGTVAVNELEMTAGEDAQ